MSKFCSNCGAQIGNGGNFCAECGKNLADISAKNVNASEAPITAHVNAFFKWFKLTCTAFAVGIAAALIGLGTAFVYAEEAGGQIKTLISVFIAGSVIAVIASVILLCMAVNIRLKPQHTRTMLRFGTRFSELSLSCMNISLALALATCYTFNSYLGFDTMFAVYITGIAAAFVVVIECGVGFVKSKYKSDKNYGKESVSEKAQTVKAAPQPQNSGPKLETAPRKTWKCSACGFDNPEHSDSCRSCGKYK